MKRKTATGVELKIIAGGIKLPRRNIAKHTPQDAYEHWLRFWFWYLYE